MATNVELKIFILRTLFVGFMAPFLICASISEPPTINIVCVEYSSVYRGIILNAFNEYNRTFPHQKIECRFIVSKQQLEFQPYDTLKGIHLVLCDPLDISDSLSALRAQATKHDFSLPPILAVTRKTEYHNQCYANDRHFIGGRGKIATILGLRNALNQCQEIMGTDWLKNVGRKSEWILEDAEGEGESCAGTKDRRVMHLELTRTKEEVVDSDELTIGELETVRR